MTDPYTQPDGESTRNVRLMAELEQSILSQLARVAGSDARVHELIEELTSWWLGRAASEAERTVTKAIEYGSNDLIEIGRNLALIAGRTVPDDEAAEMGVYFYLLGKVGRWTSALVDGKRVSDDTLLDIAIYIRMAQRIREAGGWPGKESTHRVRDS